MCKGAATGPSYCTQPETRAKLSIVHSLPALGAHGVTFLSLSSLLSHPLLRFNMSRTNILHSARNVMMRGDTVNVADTVGESIVVYFSYALKPTVVDLLQINYNLSNRTTSDAVIPLKPNSSTRFTGRTDIIRRLKDHFTSPGVGLRTRKYFLLHGMGGIGKTQIC